MSVRLVICVDGLDTFPITYSSKEDFQTDLDFHLSNPDNQVMTTWSRNGNDCNYNIKDWFYPNGNRKPVVVLTVDEWFDGRDDHEKVYNSTVSFSSHTQEEVDNRPTPRVFHLRDYSYILPSQQQITPDLIYVNMEDKDIPVVDM